MAQETLVLALAAPAADVLQRRLGAELYQFRSVPHARFSAKGEGVVVTCYLSGKLVIQGEGARAFAERYLDQRPSGPARATPPEDALASGPLIGSDECGKGDYFGPLVVCAVRLSAEETRQLEGGEVRDSKTLSDAACLRIGAALRGRFRHAIARLDPPQYNQVYARVRNVNHVLADLHAQAIRELARPGERVLVDKFGDERLLQERLRSLELQLEQRVRAESVLAVAAASIIAREEFLNALHELSEEVAVDLHKGAGEPVDRAGRDFVRLHGPQGLARVAKLHFKNTQRIAPAAR